MSGREARFEAVERNLRVALGLELFVELGFVVALLAIAGVFSGGVPTSTPLLAAAYVVVGLLVTLVVLVRTVQMLRAAQRGDAAGLRRLNIRTWTLIAFVFCAILPAVYLNEATAALRNSD